MTLALRRVRRWFAGRPLRLAPTGGAFTGQGRRFAIAQTGIRAFYAFTLYFLASDILSETTKLANRPPLTPLWPLGWLRWTSDPGAGLRALAAFAGIAIVAAAIAPGWRALRAAGWLALLEYDALKNSYGKIGHSLHLMVWVAFILIALPPGWARPAPGVPRRIRQQTLLVFWLCQAAVLLSYTMSGIGKVGGAVYQLALGEPSAFSPGAVGAHIAERLLQTHSQSATGAWLVAHPYLTWPAMPGAIGLEFFSFWIAFRPTLHRPWAAALITLHLGIYLAMTINFPQNCLLLALLFFHSPLEPVVLRPLDRLASLPFGRSALKLWFVICRRLGLKTLVRDLPASRAEQGNGRGRQDGLSRFCYSKAGNLSTRRSEPEN